MMIFFILFTLIFSNTSKAIESISIDAHCVLFTPDQHAVMLTDGDTGLKRTITLDQPILTVIAFSKEDRKKAGCLGYVITRDDVPNLPARVNTNSLALSHCHERAQARDAARELKPVTLSFHPLQQSEIGTGTDDDDESTVSTLQISGHPFDAKISTKGNWVTHLDGIYLFIFSKNGGDYDLIKLDRPLTSELAPRKIPFNFAFDLYKFDGDRGLFVQNHPTNMQSYIFEVRLYTNDKIGSIVTAHTLQLAYDSITRKPYVLTLRGVYNARYASLEVAFPEKQKSIKVHGDILFVCNKEDRWSAIPLAKPGKGDNPNNIFLLTMEPNGDFPSLKDLLPRGAADGCWERILDKDPDNFFQALMWVPTLPLEIIFDYLEDCPEVILYALVQIKPQMVGNMKYFTSLEWKNRRKKLLKAMMVCWPTNFNRAQKMAVRFKELRLGTEPTHQELAFWE